MTEKSDSSIAPAIQWYPGHMAKAKKLIKENFSLIDVSIEVADARIPNSSRNPALNELLSGKPRVLVLNKSTLADRIKTEQWIGYYKAQGLRAIAVDSISRAGIKKLIGMVKLLAEPQMKGLEAKGRHRRPVRAMIVGIPNVGKSTLINALVNQASTKTGNKPGVTKGTQWVRVAEDLELLDTPGILWPKFDNQEIGYRLAVTGAINDLVFSIEDVVKYLVEYLVVNQPEVLAKRYKIGLNNEDTWQIVMEIGKRRGFLAPGGVVKLEQTITMLLAEFRSGKLGRHTLEMPK